MHGAGPPQAQLLATLATGNLTSLVTQRHRLPVILAEPKFLTRTHISQCTVILCAASKKLAVTTKTTLIVQSGAENPITAWTWYPYAQAVLKGAFPLKTTFAIDRQAIGLPSSSTLLSVLPLILITRTGTIQYKTGIGSRGWLP
jgi:hypothetical protein